MSSASQEHVSITKLVSLSSFEISNDQSVEEPDSDLADQAKKVSKTLNENSLQSENIFIQNAFQKRKFKNEDARKP